jgi:hypothetical protein
MKRIALIGLAVAALAVGGADRAGADSTLCVGGPHCYASLAAALGAAHDGDTIRIGPGTFPGGVSIDVSVNLVGAGAQRTTIRGGGPVLTIGTIFAASEPTVSIDGVTITGGVTTSSPESQGFVGADNVIAFGGGIDVPPNADFTGGANLTVSNSVITGNRAAPTAALPFGPPCPGDVNCPFAWAGGGGINTYGNLSLANSVVSNNTVAGDASDADAAGIYSHLGAVTISNSVIRGNQALAVAPNGRFADSGGVFVEGGSLQMTGSSVSGNSATLAAGLPSSVDLAGHAGGIHVADSVATATITSTTITGNSATMTNSVGDAQADSGGLHTDIGVTLSNDVISANRVTAQTLPGSTGNVDAESGAGEFSGSFTNVRFTGNTVDASSAAGDANAGGGASVFDGGTIINGLVSDNHVHASSPFGAMSAGGGGMNFAGDATLQNTIVSGNTVAATGGSGSATGGGLNADGGPSLTLQNVVVTRNRLSGSTGLTVQGGGVYVTGPFTETHSIVAANSPDNCSGPSC